MKQARIECPHCGGNITIRQFDGLKKASQENEAKVWAAADELSKGIDSVFHRLEASFRKVFGA